MQHGLHLRDTLVALFLSGAGMLEYKLNAAI